MNQTEERGSSPQNPPAEDEITPAEAASEEKKSPFRRKNKPDDKPKKPRRSRKADKAQLIRIEELEKIMGEYGDEVDPEAIVSMYVPRRRAKRLGAALLRMNKLHLWLLTMLLLVAALFILAFMQEKMGNFTINLDRLEMFRKGISIASDGNFAEPTARLAANTVPEATNISVNDLPENLDDIDGDHNGENYVAYTYYVRNAGKEDVAYIASVTLNSCSKGAEDAVRVAIWRNGERIIYAEPAADGGEEDGCVSFLDHKLVCTYTEEEFLVGNVDKYTIVIWMEGDDPECVDAIVGGAVEFTMDISADDDDDTSLLMKFIQDIKDTLTGDKPISAAGTDAPNYYYDTEITWDNRRNQ